jgi:hypothetical protein
MSEASDSSITNEQPPAPSISHRRILWTLGLVAIVGGLAGFIFVAPEFGFGFFFGGVLAFVNYYWLKISLRRIFEGVVERGEKPGFLAIRHFGRYLTLGAILAIVFLTEIVPVIAVVLGLASFALAIVIEGLILIFSSFFKSRKL